MTKYNYLRRQELALQKLKEARNLITNRHNWAKGQMLAATGYGLTPDGQFDLAPLDPAECQFCADGAVSWVYGLRDSLGWLAYPTNSNPAIIELGKVVLGRVDTTSYRYRYDAAKKNWAKLVYLYNDGATTHADILSAFDEAIANLEQRIEAKRPIQHLKAAKERIATPNLWHKGWFYADTKPSTDPTCAVCAMGALAFAVSGNALGHDDPLALDHLDRVGRGRLSAMGAGGAGIAAYNDHHATTHADILSAFDEAIASLSRTLK